jgi:hypothetical protein
MTVAAAVEAGVNRSYVRYLTVRRKLIALESR